MNCVVIPDLIRIHFLGRARTNDGIPAFAGDDGVRSPVSAQSPSPAPDYAKDSAWLCLPGRADSCSTPLPTTALNPNGYGSNGPSEVARDPPLDCFYVYPTVSNDPGLNSDMNAGREEKLAAESQFARFASVCRTFAPVYRQMTVAAVAAYAAGADIGPAGALAYRDVAAAWHNFLRTRSHGRPFVLIGHSQGSLMIQQLIAREIENDPALAARMKLAIIPGYDVLVPQGKLVGGTFKKTPLCSRPGQTQLRDDLDQLSRAQRAPRRRDVRLCRPAGNDRRLRQSRAARLQGLGEARQLLVRALVLSRRRRPDYMVERRPAADALPAHRRPGFSQMRQ